MSLGPMQLLIIALIILVLFGRGKISELMGDFGKGIKSFKKGLGEEADSPSPPPQIPQQQAPPAPETKADPVPAETGNAKSGS
jgi:sec-independent protein translocase protein TatA